MLIFLTVSILSLKYAKYLNLIYYIMLKKVVASGVLMASLVATPMVSADRNKEISCSTDAIFSEYSCNQCFEGGERWVNGTVGGLSDLWVNTSGVPQALYKEIQTMPRMVALNGAVWDEDKVSDSFWVFSPELDRYYNSGLWAYILQPGENANWIESTEGSSYVLKTTPSTTGANAWLLVYELESNPILDNGEISTDVWTHKECVLYKSGAQVVTPKNEKPKELPKTGPEQFFLLLLLAMFLAFGVLRFKKI